MKNIEKIRIELIRRWENEKPKMTPVVFTELNGQKIVIKDESKNITGTYKAKHGWMMGLDYLKNHFPNKFVYFLGSTGNAGMADFAFADKLNLLLKEIAGEEKVIV